MKRANVIVAMVILIFWGMINEYLHVLINGILNVTPPTYQSLIPFYRMLGDVIIWLLAVVMISAAAWLAFNDDIIRFFTHR